MARLCGVLSLLVAGCFGLDRASGGGDGGEGADGAGGSDAGGYGGALPSDLVTEPRSGARLRATRWVVEGAEQFVGFVDGSLDEACQFTTAEDGSWRCLPTNITYLDRFYSDPACTQLVTRAYGACTVPTYAYEDLANGCGYGRRIFHLEGEHPAVTGVWWGGGGVGCQPWLVNAGERFFKLGAEAAPGEFAGATPVAEARTGRLEPVILMGEDGSRQFLEWHDRTLDTRCLHYRSGNDGFFCVPNGVPVGGFADPACTVPLASQRATCTTPPTWAQTTTIIDCMLSVTAQSVVGPMVSPVFQQFMTCQPYTDPTTSYWSLGEVLPASALAPFDRHPVDVGGRLEPYVYESPEGPTAQVVTWLDRERDAPCLMSRAGDGRIRCLPVFVTWASSYFSDPACLSPVNVASADPVCGAPATLAAVLDATTCPTTTSYYELGPPVTFPTVYQAFAGTCSAIDLGPGTWVTLGAQVPLDSFVEASVVVD